MQIGYYILEGDIIKLFKKILIILIALLIILCAVFSDDGSITVKTDGIDTESSTLAIPFIHGDLSELNKEIVLYASDQLNNESSNAESIKHGIADIADGYGISDADIHIESQFGEDALPMFCKVEGTSMVPTFQDGEYVMIEKTDNFSVGDCVVANVDDYGRVIKRVSKINGNKVYLTSDNKNISYEVHGNYIYKIEGLKAWTDRENIVGVVRIHNITDNSKFEISI